MMNITAALALLASTSITISDPRDEKNGVTRPPAGTKTGLVWDFADALFVRNLSEERPFPVPLVGEVKEEYKKVVGGNVDSCQTQYAGWIKYHDLKNALQARRDHEASEGTEASRAAAAAKAEAAAAREAAKKAREEAAAKKKADFEAGKAERERLAAEKQAAKVAAEQARIEAMRVKAEAKAAKANKTAESLDAQVAAARAAAAKAQEDFAKARAAADARLAALNQTAAPAVPETPEQNAGETVDTSNDGPIYSAPSVTVSSDAPTEVAPEPAPAATEATPPVPRTRRVASV